MIGIYDDKKEKHQSFEAYIKGEYDLCGYGSTQEEAIANLEINLSEYIVKLNSKLYNLQNLSYKDIVYLNSYDEKTEFQK